MLTQEQYKGESINATVECYVEQEWSFIVTYLSIVFNVWFI